MGKPVDALNKKGANGNDVEKKPTVIVVLAVPNAQSKTILLTVHSMEFYQCGPGSGKGTQCAKIAQQFGFTHVSSGEILRRESRSGSENATMIGNMLKEGILVPPKITVPLVLKAMQLSGNDKFVFDGFPRDEETRKLFENTVMIEPNLVLFFECPEEEMERRSLARNEGRDDDVMETIRERVRVFRESTFPVIQYYESKQKLRKIDATKSKEEVFEAVRPLFFGVPEDDKLNCCAIL